MYGNSTAGPRPTIRLHGNDTPLTQTKLVMEVRVVLTGEGMDFMDLSCYTVYSFCIGVCIGAASSAARAGIPDSLLQSFSLWRSSAFQRFIRTPTVTLLSIPLTLTQAPLNLGRPGLWNGTPGRPFITVVVVIVAVALVLLPLYVVVLFMILVAVLSVIMSNNKSVKSCMWVGVSEKRWRVTVRLIMVE